MILDSDLASLYRVETKHINRAVSRNSDRFPDDFRFQLAEDEYDCLRFQNGTSNKSQGRGGRRYAPYAFTEQGIAMLSTVLRSEASVQVSIDIMRAFVEMRRFLAANAQLFERVNVLEAKHALDQARNEERFAQVFDFIEESGEPVQRVFFDGQIYDAFSLLVGLVREVGREIALVDGYVDVDTLNILAKKRPGVVATIFPKDNRMLSETDAETFNRQYPTLEVRHVSSFHDRFLILDRKTGYHIGASLKDAGKKSFGINRIQDDMLPDAVLRRLEDRE